MTEEKLRILKMLETGAINATQAADLLNAMQEDPMPITELPITDEGHEKQAKWIKILITNRSTGKNKVNLRIPLKLFPWKLMEKGLFINLGDKTDNNESAYLFDKEHVMEMIKKAEPVVMVDLDVEEDDEKVLITLE